MTITKFGHSCLLVETDGVRILTDPGHYSTAQNELTELDGLLITHIHGDHCDVESIKQIRAKNPTLRILTNPQVQAKLAAEGIESEVLADGATTEIEGVAIEAFGIDHIEIHASRPRDKNVGFLIASRLFHPGDAYTVPTKPVEILALPIGGPWCKIGEAIDYALAVKPKLALPIHDGMFKEPGHGTKWPTMVLGEHGIAVRVLELGVTTEV